MLNQRKSRLLREACATVLRPRPHRPSKREQLEGVDVVKAVCRVLARDLKASGQPVTEAALASELNLLIAQAKSDYLLGLLAPMPPL